MARRINYVTLLILLSLGAASGEPVNAQTAEEVQNRGRVFASCMGCDAQIYLYNKRWYEIERPGGFVSPGRPVTFNPILHPLKGKIQWISRDVVRWQNTYQCAHDSLTGPRRAVQCTSKGWVTIN